MQLYYSTQALLTHKIVEDYYHSVFYLYVARSFYSRNPASASPYQIYTWLSEISRGDDRLHPKYLDLVQTLKWVANEKEKSRVITRWQKRKIVRLIETTGTRSFRPLIYVIPKTAALAGRVILPDAADLTNLDSEEYRFEDLKLSEFHIFDRLLSLRLLLTYLRLRLHR